MPRERSYVWKRGEPDFSLQRIELEAQIAQLEADAAASSVPFRIEVARKRLEWLDRAQSFYEQVMTLVESTVERAKELFHDVYGWPNPEDAMAGLSGWIAEWVAYGLRTALLDAAMRMERDRVDPRQPPEAELEMERTERQRESRFWAWVRGWAWQQ